MKEMVGGCCVCSDERGWAENPLVYCDGQGCTVAVHQACYGIVTVPTGPWFCRKCESQERSARVRCELCPSRDGALKRTDNNGWAHVVCALYIPEVRFGNVTTMEPIILQLVPPERFNKVCYICEEQGKAGPGGNGGRATVGACMQCNRSGCKQQFHVTCAQALGLLCEEAGNYLDNVKYCGYCQHHYSKLKKGGNVKTIPPYKPIPAAGVSPSSSPEKELVIDTSAKATGTKRKTASGITSGGPSSGAAVGAAAAGGVKPAAPPAVPGSVSKAGSGRAADGSSPLSVAGPAAELLVVGGDSKDGLKYAPGLVASGYETDGPTGKKRKTGGRRTPTAASESPAASTPTPPPDVGVGPVLPGEAIPEVVGGRKVKLEVGANVTVGGGGGGAVPPGAQPPSVVVRSPNVIATAGGPVPGGVSSPHQGIVVSVPLSAASAAVPTAAPVSVASGTPAPPPATDAAATSSDLTPPPQGPPAAQPTLFQQLQQSMAHSAHHIQPPQPSPPPPRHTPSPQQTSTLVMVEEPQPAHHHPAKRQRSQSTEKPGTSASTPPVDTKSVAPVAVNRSGKPRRGAGGSSSLPSAPTVAPVTKSRRGGGDPTPPPLPVKESPPSSPGSESAQSAPAASSSSRRSCTVGSAAASACAKAALPVTGVGRARREKDERDVKPFQNGVSAPHMLGNQLNPASTMAQKMSDTLSAELEAHGNAYAPADSSNSSLVGPPLHSRVIASARSAAAAANGQPGGGAGASSSAAPGTVPQSLDQLLERQWEQGSQFLMEQAQHFDIASLLSCLHQLRAENLRLEEHVSSLLQRRDHLLAVNARLAIPLASQPPAQVNNVHPQHGGAAGATPAVAPRHNNSYLAPQHSHHHQHAHAGPPPAPGPSPGPPPAHPGIVENGLPPEPYPQPQAQPHRNPSPSVRASVHQAAPPQYAAYQPAPPPPPTSSPASAASQMMRRDSGGSLPDLHHPLPP
ncbi:protein AF-17-like [Schistocerca gregaria]|uniref:protein AF-17-like n=1 Tax=Schistocerca gregaria TaxID=7010 RepID=UPI00211DF803|nr:protein AF-17-like [Schistocerca gregaria]